MYARAPRMSGPRYTAARKRVRPIARDAAATIPVAPLRGGLVSHALAHDDLDSPVLRASLGVVGPVGLGVVGDGL